MATHEKKIIAIPGIHYFDAHRLEALLLTASELQLHPRAGNSPEPEGAGDAVADRQRWKLGRRFRGFNFGLRAAPHGLASRVVRRARQHWCKNTNFHCGRHGIRTF